MTKKEVLKLVTTEYDGLNKVEKKYKNDYEIVEQAIRFWPYQIKYASSYLKTNKELGLIAVKEDGLLISELEYNLRNDNDIILAALNQDGTAIKYINKDKKENSEYIDVAIKSNPFSICYINENFITIEQAKYCLSLEPALINYIGSNLKNNLELIKSVDKVDSEVHLNLEDEELLHEIDPFHDFGNSVIYEECDNYITDEDYSECITSSDELPF